MSSWGIDVIAEGGIWVLLLAFGGWVAVDGTAFGQFMISRPVIAATVAGWIVGSPVEGAALGLLLEIFHLVVLPVGAARYPEGGPPAVVAGATAGTLASLGLGGWVAGIAFVLVWERVAGESVRWLRLMNAKIAGGIGSGKLPPDQLPRRHLLGLGIDFLRGVLLVGVGLLLMNAIVQYVPGSWATLPQGTGVLLLGVLAALLAGTMGLFGRSTISFFVLGGVCGLLLKLLS